MGSYSGRNNFNYIFLMKWNNITQLQINKMENAIDGRDDYMITFTSFQNN